MSQNLFMGLTMPVALALLALVLILLAVGRVLLALRKPVSVRAPSRHGEAPYKVEAPSPPGLGGAPGAAAAAPITHAGCEAAKR